MTGNFSQAPTDALTAALAKNYVGVHIEQGVPVLDRDLNLLGDLIAATVRQIVGRHIGDGTAGDTDFAVEANGDPLDFRVRAGTFLAGGTPLSLAANVTYRGQVVPAGVAPLPALTAPPTGSPPRTDIVYLDMWYEDVDEQRDVALGNAADVGQRTSTRRKAQFLVRVAESAAVPPAAPAEHSFVPLATLTRTAPATVDIADRRTSFLSIAQMAKRLATIQSVLGPAITSIAPNHVLPGQSNPIVVSGRNLDLGGATVMLGPTPGIVATPTAVTTLSVSVPANATPGNWPLTVTTAVGSATAPVQVRIDPPPPPPTFVASGGGTPQIVPAHAPTGTQIILNGSNFTGVNRVTFNTTPPVYAVPGGDLISVTDTIIKVRVPDALGATIGAATTIGVGVDGVPTMQGTSATLFTVDPQPIVTPAFGGTGTQIATTPVTNPVRQSRGGVITLSGQNFGTSAATTQVQFIGTNAVIAQAGDMVSVTPTAIAVKVPAALTVAVAPGNSCRIVVIVQAVKSLPSDDRLLIT